MRLKKVKITWIFVILAIGCVLTLFSTKTVHAARKTIISNRNVVLSSNSEYNDENENVSNFDVMLPKKGVLVLAVKVTMKDEVLSGGFRVELFNASGKRIQNDYASLKGYDTGDSDNGWFYNDGLLIPKGKYRYRLTNTSDADVSMKFSVYAYDKLSKSAKIKKSAKVKGGNWVKLGRINKNQAPIVKKIKISNKKVITDWYVEANGTVWAYGNKSGSSTVTVQLKNGKKYKSKVKVSAPDPNYFADVYGYYTRDNYFLVRFKNKGTEKLVIHSAGAYSMDADYKSYDRKLYLPGGKDIVIKPGKSKRVKFMVRGSTTWPDYENHTVRYYFTYGGKKYLGSVWYEDSVYKKGKKWYGTYWDSYEEDYQDWI